MAADAIYLTHSFIGLRTVMTIADRVFAKL